MTEKQVAKNLLLGDTCSICCLLIYDPDDGTEYCKKDNPFSRIPEERTCEYFWEWEDDLRSDRKEYIIR